MGALKSVRVKNLRCFADTEFIQLRPINLLVGKNSVGKSTFARLLPLLRQSAEEEKRSPVLWYGRLVDFGNFFSVVNRHAESREIEFSFKLTIPKSRSMQGRFAYYFPDADESFLGEDTEITATLRLEQKDKTKPCYASYIALKLFGNICEIRLSESQRLQELNVNGQTWTPGDHPITPRVSQQRIFPGISFYRQVSRKTEFGEHRFLTKFDPFRVIIREAVYAEIANRHMAAETVDRILSTIPIASDAEMLRALQMAPYATKPFKTKALRLSVSDSAFIYFRNLMYLKAIPHLLSEVDRVLNETLLEVRYIEPLRATAQRYYRLQELAVDELDSKGTNVAMFIDSLTETERSRLNSWLDEHFSIRIRPNNEGGHVALELINSESSAGTNLADLGFGFSQLLPIVLQLWHSSQAQLFRSRGSRENKSSIVVIEQPELHLHPAYQAKVADVTVAALKNAREQNRELTVIAETHSPHLINRFGQLIEAGKITPEDVQVILFEESDVSGQTLVRPTYFDAEGVLVNWPYGFFEPGF